MIKACMSEEDQRNRFLESYNYDNVRFFCEVPVFCRSVDVVKYDTISGAITAIEFKRNDWKRAINQALGVRICFDYLEICVLLPKTEKTRNNMIGKCAGLGIGLYFFDDSHMSFDKALEPVRDQSIWAIQKKSILDYMGGFVSE
jgi:hypothetical protein